MKYILIVMVFALVAVTRAFAGDVGECEKLKITGRFECSYEGEKLLLSIKRTKGVLTVKAVSEDETFIIDGTERARYSWSTDFTYTSTCTQNQLIIDSFKKGMREGTIKIAPKDSAISYSISKKGQTLSLDCRKL